MLYKIFNKQNYNIKHALLLLLLFQLVTSEEEIEYEEEHPDLLIPATVANNTVATAKLSKYKKNIIEEQKKAKLMELAHEALSKDDDEYEITGKRIAFQLKDIAKPQRIIAEKLISDVIYYAKIDKLTKDSSVCNHSSSQFQPVKSPSQLICSKP